MRGNLVIDFSPLGMVAGPWTGEAVEDFVMGIAPNMLLAGYRLTDVAVDRASESENTLVVKVTPSELVSMDKAIMDLRVIILGFSDEADLNPVGSPRFGGSVSCHVDLRGGNVVEFCFAAKDYLTEA